MSSNLVLLHFVAEILQDLGVVFTSLCCRNFWNLGVSKLSWLFLIYFNFICSVAKWKTPFNPNSVHVKNLTTNNYVRYKLSATSNI